MEIEFELENSDLVFTFEPWNDRNRSRREKVQWKLPNGSYTGALANMFYDLSVQTTTNRSDDEVGNL